MDSFKLIPKVKENYDDYEIDYWERIGMEINMRDYTTLLFDTQIKDTQNNVCF